MQIKSVEINNFRLLREVSLGLEARTTLIVGRNNCGKTSIAEVFRRLLSDKSPFFRLEDFSLGCHEQFWAAFAALHAGSSRSDATALLPVIGVTLDIAYDVDAPDLGPLSDCIIDLDPACTFARVVFTYGPKATALDSLFFDLEPPRAELESQRLAFFRAMKIRLGLSYEACLEAVDPNDPSNRKPLDLKTLTTLVRGASSTLNVALMMTLIVSGMFWERWSRFYSSQR